MRPVTELEDRYGTPSRAGRAALVAALAVLIGALGVWLAWVVWIQSTPAVESELISFGPDGTTGAHAVIQVDLADDAKDPLCEVFAVDESGGNAGTYRFTPKDGRNEVSFRTLREAKAVKSPGCTADGQKQPR